MYIEFLAPSPKAGQQEHVAREIGASLIVAGFAKEIPQAPPTPKITFGVFKGGMDATPIALSCTCYTCGRQDHYIGAPDKESIARGFLARLCIHAKAFEVPENVRADYARQYNPSPFGWATGVPSINAPSKNTGEGIR